MTLNLYEKLLDFFKNKDGKITIAQWPNIPILGWFLFKLASMLVSAPGLDAGLSAISTAFLFTWAYLEITDGASYFRRTLGVAVMLGTVIGLFK